jgi:hypothetical protein
LSLGDTCRPFLRSLRRPLVGPSTAVVSTLSSILSPMLMTGLLPTITRSVIASFIVGAVLFLFAIPLLLMNGTGLFRDRLLSLLLRWLLLLRRRRTLFNLLTWRSLSNRRRRWWLRNILGLRFRWSNSDHRFRSYIEI